MLIVEGVDNFTKHIYFLKVPCVAYAEGFQ